MTDLLEFHRTRKDGTVIGVNDFKIFQYITENEHIFVIGGTPYIYQRGVYIADENGTKLKSKIRNLIIPDFIRSDTITRIYRLFLIADELQIKADEVNQFPKYWIPFRNGFYDLKTREMHPVAPSYKAVNQIPHEYIPYEHCTGQTVDEWLKFIVPDESDREMLLEYCGYCLTTDTSQQKFMILCGVGGSGKSTLIRLMETIIGAENISNVSLKELSQRFASYGLMGKLLNSSADLEITALDDVSVIKKLLGEDSIRAEQKGKDAISFRNYSKLIFSTNELPTVLNERTNGFYRRLLVLNMDNQPRIIKPNFLDDLISELPYFISLIVKAAERMYRNGTIQESERSKHAVQQLQNDSDTVEAWINEECTRDPTSQTDRTLLYERYERYCSMSERTKLIKNNFYKAMRAKGFKDRKTNGIRMLQGISLGKSALNNCPVQSTIEDDPTLPY